MSLYPTPPIQSEAICPSPEHPARFPSSSEGGETCTIGRRQLGVILISVVEIRGQTRPGCPGILST